MSALDWPDATLTPLARARVLAATIPGAGYAEATFDVPYELAWPRIVDLEHSVPAADDLVRRVRIHRRHLLPDGAEELRLSAMTSFFVPQRFTVRLEDGWCLMRGTGRVFVVVMAAEPTPDGRTRYGHLEATPRRFAGPLRRIHQRNVRRDVAGFGRVARAGSG